MEIKRPKLPAPFTYPKKEKENIIGPPHHNSPFITLTWVNSAKKQKNKNEKDKTGQIRRPDSLAITTFKFNHFSLSFGGVTVAVKILDAFKNIIFGKGKLVYKFVSLALGTLPLGLEWVLSRPAQISKHLRPALISRFFRVGKN